MGDTFEIHSKGNKASHCTGVKYSVEHQDTEGHLNFDSNDCMSEVKSVHIHTGFNKLRVDFKSGSHDFHSDGTDKDMCCVCDGCRGGNCHFDCHNYDSPPRRRTGGGHRRRRVDPADDPKKCPCNNKEADAFESTLTEEIAEEVV